MKWTRRILVAAGVAAVAYGVYGLAADDLATEPRYRLFLLASLLWPPLVALPVAYGLGALIARRIPALWRPVVQGVLFTSTMAAGVALPSIVGNGHDLSMPSALPRDYPRGLAVVLGVVWAAGLVVVAVRFFRLKKGTTS